MPDRVALGLSAEALAARLRDQFRFVAREMPPSTSSTRACRASTWPPATPTEAELAARAGRATGCPRRPRSSRPTPRTRPSSSRASRTTSARRACGSSPPSTPSSPCGGSGSASSGSAAPTRRAPRRCYCHFQIERVDSKERLRHIEHEIFSVLKCVFTAVEDFQDMLRTVREVGAAPAQPPRRLEQDVASARAFLDWLLEDNYIFHGHGHATGSGPDGLAGPHPGERHRRLHRPDPAARGLPRPHGGGRGPPRAPRPRTTASSTSTTATTPPPSTTWSRSTTS